VGSRPIAVVPSASHWAAAFKIDYLFPVHLSLVQLKTSEKSVPP
jgi:hypothetical protein